MEQSSLFQNEHSYVPLAHKLRPKNLNEFVGQDHIIHDGGAIDVMLQNGVLTSCILWGPPGCGKTTLARLMSDCFECEFYEISAIFSGVADLKKAFSQAKQNKSFGKTTILFVDEIHRFNKAQQDAFLPFVEDGTVLLIGATTENPSFELNSALLSRCPVIELKRLSDDALEALIKHAEDSEGMKLPIEKEARDWVVHLSDGDGRYLLSLVEKLFSTKVQGVLTKEQLEAILQKKKPVYDKKQDGHYNLISALHKSLRGSDVDASLYWFSRMIKGGEDPHYIARRLVRFASEDIGMADPNALSQTLSAWQAYERLGSPEGELCLAQTVIYLATAPKSNATYVAHKAALQSADTFGSLMPPKIILNAPTKMMKEMGYGKGYQYDHDMDDSFSGQNYFPDNMERQSYYKPKEKGFEAVISKRTKFWQKLREKKSK